MQTVYRRSEQWNDTTLNSEYVNEELNLILVNWQKSQITYPVITSHP